MAQAVGLAVAVRVWVGTLVGRGGVVLGVPVMTAGGVSVSRGVEVEGGVGVAVRGWVGVAVTVALGVGVLVGVRVAVVSGVLVGVAPAPAAIFITKASVDPPTEVWPET